jgi:hypothetical protein
VVVAVPVVVAVSVFEMVTPPLVDAVVPEPEAEVVDAEPEPEAEVEVADELSVSVAVERFGRLEPEVSVVAVAVAAAFVVAVPVVAVVAVVVAALVAMARKDTAATVRRGEKFREGRIFYNSPSRIYSRESAV